MDGTDLSSCPLPCTLTKTQVSKAYTTEYPFPGIRIDFVKTMAVTKTDFLPFSLNRFLSSVGGSLGLWLGLGMVQLGELGVRGVTWILNKGLKKQDKEQQHVVHVEEDQ